MAAQNTEFGKTVRKRLIDREMTISELAAKVADKTGLYCDTRYMSHILRGDRNPPKIVSAISEILGIGEEEG